MKKLLLAAAMLGSAPAVAIPSGPVNLVANGGFEDNDGNFNFAGWTSDGYWAGSQTTVLGASEGRAFAGTDCIRACSISQVLSLVAGRSYRLSFDYNAGYAPTVAATHVALDDDVLADLTGTALDWVRHQVRFSVRGDTAVLRFVGSNADDFSGIDNVSVTAAVPEPATWGLMFGGFALVGIATRRRLRSLAA